MKERLLHVGAVRPGLVLGMLMVILVPARKGSAIGYWSPVSQGAPGSVNLMLLLPDGTVMAANNPVGICACSAGKDWYRLTPDNLGSYANGTWTRRSSMNDSRDAYASVVLRDGRVFVAGGEYGTGRATAEIYDPVADSWSRVSPPTSLLDPGQFSPQPQLIPQRQGFADACSVILPNGNVLISPVFPNTINGTLVFNPDANSWAAGPPTGKWQAEATWVKLPDGSILTVDPDRKLTERFIPSLNLWTTDVLPVSLWANLSPVAVGEIGPALLLADGRAFFIGGSGHTALYTPPSGSTPGSWVAGPDILGGLVAADAPGAMMVNGKVLCAGAPPPSVSGSDVDFLAPTSFFEYDPTDGPIGGFTQVSSPTGGMTDNIPSYKAAMLALPDGTILYSDEWWQLYVYHPDGSPLTKGKPSVTSVTRNADGSLHLTGTLFNGISQGASYGDDAQMDSNYPLVRLTDDQTGQVRYARTFNWSSTDVQTGMTPVTTEAALPATLLPGVYSLAVVANGISSDPIIFHEPVWVDFNSMETFQFGSFFYPWHTLALGVTAVAPGEEIRIKSGASSETMIISKPMTITAFGGPATIGQ